MDKNMKNLLQLIKDNPELPIVPMVDGDIVMEDTNTWWRGYWGNAYIEYYIEADDRIIFYDDEEVEETLERVLGQDEFEKIPEEDWDKRYEELPWIKAIVVYIKG